MGWSSSCADPDGNDTSMDLALQHLKRDSTYVVEVRTGYAKAPTVEVKGSELAHLHVDLPQPSSSELVFYHTKQPVAPVTPLATPVNPTSPTYTIP